MLASIKSDFCFCLPVIRCFILSPFLVEFYLQSLMLQHGKIRGTCEPDVPATYMNMRYVNIRES